MRVRLAFLLLATASWASPLLEKVAKSLETRSLRIELDWSQTPGPGLGSPMQAQGVLRVAPGNRFSFKTSALTLVSDGTTLWQYMPAAKQVLVQKLSKIDPGLLPIGILQSALRAQELSSQPETHEGVKASRIELKSDKLPLSRYVKIRLWIREDNQEPMELAVQDDQGGAASWKLRSVKEFEPQAKSFSFAAPAGTNVVDTRQ
jgi:outer membrane lipoprotein-sorting protein